VSIPAPDASREQLVEADFAGAGQALAITRTRTTRRVISSLRVEFKGDDVAG